MSASGSSENRSVVPRWRTSSSFASVAESGALVVRKEVLAEFDGSYEKLYADWQENRSVWHLADLFSTAVVENRTEHIKELAKAVQGAGDRVPPALQRLAANAMSGATKLALSDPFALDLEGSQEVLARRIAQIKKHVIEYTRDGFAWHDLAYLYNLLGESKKAERAILAALKVSDSHRVIARGASRFFMHQRDSDNALKVLRRAQGFSKDPWLLSAHLAISQASGVESAHIGVARRLLDDLGERLQTSELGMAMATHELLNGKMKKAKIFARSAGINPTENALAQAVWLSPRLNVDVVRQDVVASAKLGYEARSWEAYYRGHWEETMRHAVEWLKFEPFSIVPALHGSFVASTLLRDYRLAVSVAEFGLRANPNAWMLRNNLIVGLVLSNDLDRAVAEFNRLTPPDADSRDEAVWRATAGLLKYRSGEVQDARQLYASSKEALQKMKDRTGQIVLALYQSVEEANAGDAEYSKAIIDGVYDSLKLGKREGDLLSLLHEVLGADKRSEDRASSQ